MFLIIPKRHWFDGVGWGDDRSYVHINVFKNSKFGAGANFISLNVNEVFINNN